MILATDPRVLAGALGVLVLLVILPFLIILGVAAKYGVSFMTVLSMKLRKVPPLKILGAHAKAKSNGIDLDLGHLEAHFLAGGRVDAIVDALVSAKVKGWEVGYQTFAVLDLVGDDPVKRCKDATSPDDLEPKPS